VGLACVETQIGYDQIDLSKARNAAVLPSAITRVTT
jgi:hypothetical protein